MRRKALLSYILFATSCMAGASNHSVIDSVVIKKIPWHIQTPVDVSCAYFESEIKPEEYYICDSRIIDSILKKIMSLEQSKGETLNVRCKMFFYSSDSLYNTACMDEKHILYDGVLYNASPDLIRIVDNLHGVGVINDNKNHNCISNTRIFPFKNGKDSLFQYIEKQSERIIPFIKREIHIDVMCSINSKGETLDVKIKTDRDDSNNYETEQLKKVLSDIFMNEIRWIPNKERYPKERVSVCFFYRMPDE